jgi:prophage regulatory protein
MRDRNRPLDMMSTEMPPLRVMPDRILRLPQVCKMTGLRRSFLCELQAERRFPRSIKLGARAVGWLEGEIQAWMSTRIELSRRPAPKDERVDGLSARQRDQAARG